MTLDVRVTDDIAACHALRREVFIEEQHVPAEVEIDGMDDEAIHLLATLDGTPVGTARILCMDGKAKIGRVCVLRQYRGQHIGVELMRAVMAEAKARGLRGATLGAQLPVIGFYERLGYTAEGDVFQDGGIPHRTMTAPL